MRSKNYIETFRKLSVSIICVSAGLALQWSCSTANEAGRCTAYEAPKYVGAMSDTDGKPWQIVVQPKVADFTCDAAKKRGKITFSAVVLDGQKQAKPAVAIQAVFSGKAEGTAEEGGTPGFYKNSAEGDDNRKAEQDDVATDACGVATFTFEYVCPEERKSIGGTLFMQTGPLFSEPIKVTLENTVQDPPVAGAVVTANPGGGGGGG